MNIRIWLKNLKGCLVTLKRRNQERGPHKVPDGQNWDAIYCMRDMLRELPLHLFEKEAVMTPEVFMDTMASSYASKQDRTLTEAKTRKIHEFQKRYWALVQQAANAFKKTERKIYSKSGCGLP